MSLFEFFNFLLFISPFNGFLFKGSCSSKSILFIYSFFTEENTVQPFFFLLKTISGGISSKHIISLRHDHFFFSFSLSDAKLRREPVISVSSSWSYIFTQYQPEGGFDRFRNLILQYRSVAIKSFFKGFYLKSQSILVFLISVPFLSWCTWFLFFCMLLFKLSNHRSKKEKIK